MLEVTVKTLDGKNRTFKVEDDTTVKEFKEKIAGDIEITAESQRLIYLGRVLQDDKKLREYDVDGKTMHVVQRAPPQVRLQQETPAQSTSGGATGTTNARPSGNQGNQQFMTAIHQAIQRGMGEAGRGAQVSARQSADGNSLDVHINLGQIGQQHSESQHRLDAARRMIQRANRTLNRLETGPTRRRRAADTTANQQQASGTSGSEQQASGTSDSLRPGAGTSEARQGGARQMETDDSDMEIEHQDDTLSSGEEESREAEVANAVMAVVEEITEIEMEAQVHIADDEGEEHLHDGGAINTVPEATVQVEIPSSTSQHNQASGVTSGTQTDQAARAGTQTDGTNTSSAGTQTETAPNVEHPRPSALAELMSEVLSLNTRLHPYLERYQQLMRDDPNFSNNEEEMRAQQRLFNLTSEAMHYVAHAYHSISDLMIDMRRPPPRTLHAPPTPRPTIIQQAIPIQARMNVQQIPVASFSNTSTVSSQQSSSTQATTTTTQASNAPATTSSAFLATPTSAGATGTTTNHGQGADAQAHNQSGGQFPGLPRFMDPGMIQNLVRMATQGAAPGQGGQVRGQVILGPIRVNGPINSTGGVGRGGQRTSAPQPPPPSNLPPPPPQRPPTSSTGQSQPSGNQPRANQPRPQRWTVSGGHVRPMHMPIPGGPGGARPRGGVIAFPGGPGGVPPPPLNLNLPPGVQMPSAVDPYLPCHSRHFLNRRTAALARQPAPNQQSGTTGNQQTGSGNQQTGNQAATGNQQSPDQLIAGLVSNMMGNIMSQQNNPAPSANAARQAPTSSAPGGPQPRPVNPFAALFGGDVHQPVPGQAGAAPDNFMQQLGSILQQPAAANQPDGNTAPPFGSQSATPQGGQSAQGASQQVSNDVITQMLRGVSNAVMQASAGQNTGTIGEFLQGLGQQYQISPNERGVLAGFSRVLTHNLTFVDLMQVFFGNAQPLQSLRVPLQDYIRERLLSGGEATEENIERGVSELLTETSDMLESSMENLETRDDIDYEATLNTFLENNLTSLITFVMNSSEDSPSFGADLSARVRRLIHEFITLGDVCLGQEAFSQYVASLMSDFGSDVNPAILQWMRQVSVHHLQTVRNDVRLTASDVQQYVVKQSTPQKMDTSSQKSSETEDAFMSADEGEVPSSSSRHSEGASSGGVRPKSASTSLAGGQKTEPSSSPKPASAAPDDISQSPAARGVPFPLQAQNGNWLDCGSEYSAAGHAPPVSDRARQAARCGQKPDSKPPASPSQGEPWHTVVPEAWVPVMARDAQTQRQEKQRAHSDAYIAAMPAKRRKVIHDSRPDSTAFSQPSQHLATVVTETASALGLQPVTSQQALARDLAENSELHEAFHAQVREDVRQRCRNDTDLLPQRHPSTEKYFGNRKS